MVARSNRHRIDADGGKEERNGHIHQEQRSIMQVLNGNLQLRYAFTPRPNPIRASAHGANPNLADVGVIISNPRSVPVTIRKITIRIPTGENIGLDLSSIANLPAPTYDSSGAWTITASGDTITIEPVDGDSGTITDTILFLLEKIAINETPGVVPITVTEFYPAAPKAIDNISHSLVKLESDFPVIDFYASPTTLHDFGQTTTLFWKCSDEGTKYSYGLSSNDWQPRDCLDGGICFSCADGVAGVTTPGLNATTRFTLSVIRTDSGGSRVEWKKLSIVVTILVPSVLENSFVDQIGCDRIVSMHWIAFNAVRCAVLLDGEVIDADAPTNTYARGYRRLLPDAPGRHQLSVIAYSQSGARAPHSFPDIRVRTPAIIDVGGAPRAIAITPESKHALVVSKTAAWTSVLKVIDIATGTIQAKAIPLPVGTVHGIAITPDGKLALAANLNVFRAVAPAKAPESFAEALTDAYADTGRPRHLLAPNVATNMHGLTIIDLARQVVASELHVPGAMRIAITPDGRSAFVTGLAGFVVTVIDIATRTIERRISMSRFGSNGIAITPDGKLALVVNTTGYVSVIDIHARTLEPAHIPVGAQPQSIAITPDGRLALVAGESESGLTVINIAARRAESKTIPIPAVDVLDASAITITRDGSLALVLGKGGIISIIDIAQRTVFADQIRIAASHGIAGTPNSRNIVAANSQSGTITIL